MAAVTNSAGISARIFGGGTNHDRFQLGFPLVSRNHCGIPGLGRPQRAASKTAAERHPSLLQGPRWLDRVAARSACSLHSAPSDFTRCDCETYQ